MLEAIQQYFLTCLLNVVTVVYVLTKLFNNREVYLKVKTYIMIFIMVLLSIINFQYADPSIRFIISTIYIIFCSRIIFTYPLHKIIVTVLLEQCILFVAELIYALVVIFISPDGSLYITEGIFGIVILNVLVSTIAIILINIKFIRLFCNKIIESMETIKQKTKYTLAFIFIATLNILVVVIYVNAQSWMMVATNVLFILVYSYILFLLLNEKNQNIKFKEENKLLLDNLNEYEKMLDYQRVANHENKNQLLVIKSIASKNNKKLHDYLDEVIKEKRQDNEILYNSAKRIPSGGLQGLVYQKMLLMQEQNINLDLNVSKEVRKIDLSSLNAKINFDICRSIGIIIDNAIEEVSKLEEKELSISMYKDNENFIIEIANKCKELPDMEKIDQKGYTTKEKGHGYGLSLLKDICEKNKNIENERRIIGNIFLQIIKIKI